MLMPVGAEAWRKASPDPSESWTKPYPLVGLNHLTCPRTAKPDDPVQQVLVGRRNCSAHGRSRSPQRSPGGSDEDLCLVPSQIS